jgi:hypothetical protein
MLPIHVPIGSWRFPTDTIFEFNSPFFDNEGIIWGMSIEDGQALPVEFQSSLDIYNEWCAHAYDWQEIFAFHEEVDF